VRTLLLPLFRLPPQALFAIPELHSPETRLVQLVRDHLNHGIRLCLNHSYRYLLAVLIEYLGHSQLPANNA